MPYTWDALSSTRETMRAWAGPHDVWPHRIVRAQGAAHPCATCSNGSKTDMKCSAAKTTQQGL